jgi:hypothetical protein
LRHHIVARFEQFLAARSPWPSGLGALGRARHDRVNSAVQRPLPRFLDHRTNTARHPIITALKARKGRDDGSVFASKAADKHRH